MKKTDRISETPVSLAKLKKSINTYVKQRGDLTIEDKREYILVNEYVFVRT